MLFYGFNDNKTVLVKHLTWHIADVQYISQPLCECYILYQGEAPSQPNTD